MNKITLFLIACVLTSCTLQHSVSLVPQSKGDVEILLTEFPEKAYTEVALVESRGSDGLSKSYYIGKLKKRAQKHQADAIIGIRFDYAADGTIYASAVAIKYDN
jgi:hypothetical protein